MGTSAQARPCGTLILGGGCGRQTVIRSGQRPFSDPEALFRTLLAWAVIITVSAKHGLCQTQVQAGFDAGNGRIPQCS